MSNFPTLAGTPSHNESSVPPIDLTPEQLPDTTSETVQWESLDKLTRDMKKAASLLSRQHARWLTDMYYQMQQYRITSANQIRQSGETNEPNEVFTWFLSSFKSQEANLKNALGTFARTYKVGKWLQSIVGIGDVLSAGLLGHLDIRMSKVSASGFIRYCGQDPKREWLGREKATTLVKKHLDDIPNSRELELINLVKIGEEISTKPDSILKAVTKEGKKCSKAELIKYLSKPPYNSFLKTLCFKINESFVKFKNHPKGGLYGGIYETHKLRIMARNERGEYAETAAEILKAKNYNKSTEAYKAYSEGKLPQAHMHMRAMRKVISIFLSHLHHVMYLDYYGENPYHPYAFDKLDHDRDSYIAPPNLEVLQEPGESLTRLYDSDESK